MAADRALDERAHLVFVSALKHSEIELARLSQPQDVFSVAIDVAFEF